MKFPMPPKVSAGRAQSVIEEITEGSNPHWRFYALLITSAMIAAFGLVSNSVAVIIGAMLVSPLMMPVFGIALGMLQGNPKLLGRAFRAELGGAGLAIAASCVFGLFEFQVTAGQATPEMLSRTHPSLIDLLVAIFAGFAGAIAMVDERISPALPGVAIATAIVPPLSTCGLCLAMGAFSGAGGALLLFLANIVSILIVSLVTFVATGLARPAQVESWRGLTRRFGPTALGFLVVASVLTNSLVHIVRARKIKSGIRETLISRLELDHASDLEEFKHHVTGGRVQILATVRSPRVLKPARVSVMKKTLEEALEMPVDLVVRTVMAKDVTPRGSRLQVKRPDFDGKFLATRPEGTEAKEAMVEQVIREYFEGEPGFELTNVEYGAASKGEGLVLAYIDTLRRLASSEIDELQNVLRGRLGDEKLEFFVRVDTSQLESNRGPVRVEWTLWQGATEAEIEQIPEWDEKIRTATADTTELLPLHVHYNFHRDRLRLLVEVAGPSTVDPLAAKTLQDRLTQELGKPIELNLWCHNDFVVNAEGYTTFEALSNPELKSRSRILRELFGSEVASSDDE